MNKMKKIEVTSQSKQVTAKKAVEILVNSNKGFKEPSKIERQNVLIAFAKKNKVVYGKAFDIIKISGEAFSLENIEEVEKNLNKIIIYEVKSTSKKSIESKFGKYFFGLTTAELLVAQNLKNQFKFIFVNTLTNETMELTVKEVFERAKGIYPVWSIQF